MGIVALIFGVISLIACWLFIVGAVPAVVAIVTGYFSRREGSKNGNIGFWMGVAGLIISTVGWLAFFLILGSLMGPIW